MEYVNNFFVNISNIKLYWSNITINILDNLVTLIKLFCVIVIFTVTVLISLLLRILLLPAPKIFYININIRYLIRPLCLCLLYVAGVKINHPKNIMISNSVIVSNHWGYIDSLTLMALSPCIIISNVDIMQLPLIGKIMILMGFVFVDRRNKRSIPIVLEKASIILSRTNLNIAFFPEGGTGDGFTLRKFKSSFFDLAIMAEKNVVPVEIQIDTINNKIPDENIINRVVYHNYPGSLFHHILNALRLRSIEVSYNVLPEISYYGIYSKYLSRKKICEIAEEEINDYFNKNKKY